MPSIIKERGTVAIEKLTPYYKNARRGAPNLSESLGLLDQYRSICVNEGTKTGRPWEVLCGNNTMRAALEIGWTEIDYELVDVDEKTAAKINLGDNKWNDLADYDKDVLLDHLSDLDGDYEGTGWTEDEVDRMLTPPEDEEPEPTSQMGDLEYRVVVDCDSEEHQTRLLQQFEAEGLNARPLMS